MSGHYSCLFWRARCPSIAGQLLARHVFIERCHVDLKRGETTCKSLVGMGQEKTHEETSHSTLFLALWLLLLHCFIVSHSRRLDTLLGRCQRLFC